MTIEILMYAAGICMLIYIIFSNIQTRMKIRQEKERLEQLRAEEIRVKMLEWETRTAGMTDKEKLELALKELKESNLDFHIGRRDD